MEEMRELLRRIDHAKFLVENDGDKAEILKILDVPCEEEKIVLTKREFYKLVAECMKEEASKKGMSFLTQYGVSTSPYDVTEFRGWKELTDKMWDKCARIG